ncbi:TPA: ABC transporter permease [Staphylococcus aureus]|nr:ABC transporter permease [Staphylococcus aureus]
MEGNLLQQLFNYYVTNFGYLWDLFFKHLLMSVYGVLFAALIGIPLGILLARYTKLSGFVITIANIIQTVPVIAMLAILMLVMGLGSETVVLTVFLYALLPIIKNTYTGIASVDAIGVVAVGSFIGAPTLGDIVIRGTNATDGTTFILAGAIPIAIIAIVIDVLLRFLEKRLDPTTRHRKNQSNHRPQSINM